MPRDTVPATYQSVAHTFWASHLKLLVMRDWFAVGLPYLQMRTFPFAVFFPTILKHTNGELVQPWVLLTILAILSLFQSVHTHQSTWVKPGDVPKLEMSWFKGIFRWYQLKESYVGNMSISRIMLSRCYTYFGNILLYGANRYHFIDIAWDINLQCLMSEFLKQTS